MTQTGRVFLVCLGALLVAAVHCAVDASVARRLYITFHAMTDSNELTVAVSGSRENEETPRRRSHGLPYAGSLIEKRPPMTTTAMDEERGADATFDTNKMKNQTLLVPPGRTKNETLVVSVATEAPVTVSIPTQTLATIAVSPEVPVKVSGLTDDITRMNLTMAETPVGRKPGQVDTTIPTTQSSYINIKTNAPASTDAVAISREKAAVFPLLTPAPLAPELGRNNSPSDTRFASKTGTPIPLPASFDSSGSNHTVKASSASGSKGARGGTIPGQVHARSSAEVSLNGSTKVADPGSLNSFRFQDEKMKKGVNSSSGDYSGGCSTNCFEGGAREKPNSDATRSSDDGDSDLKRGLLNPGGVTDVNTRSASFYSLDTGSIFAIVGVIAGIVGLLLLFVAISRKKYTVEDDESSLSYSHNMDIHSAARLSPTFMENDSFMESGFNGTTLVVAVPSYDGVSSASRESSDEVPSLRGHMMAFDHSDDISVWNRAASMHIFNRDIDTENVRMSSEGSSITSSSDISGSWSSVLASDTERYASRNTRDTSLSAWSATNWSPHGSSASGMARLSSADCPQASGSNSSRSSPRIINHLPDGTCVAGEPVESSPSLDSTEV